MVPSRFPAAVAAFILAGPGLPALAESPMIESGSEVAMTYTLTVEGEVVDSNQGQEPLVYTQGGGQILPALEAALAGLKAGESRKVDLSAADGYGEINEAAFQDVPAEQIPEEARFVGALLQSPAYPGPIRVAAVTTDSVTLDFNHPLAGKPLNFDITIVTVSSSTAP